MERIIIANHKMNLTKEQISDYLKKIKEKNIIFFPSSIYLPYFIDANLTVGIQNIYIGNNGAYTGEISSSQAKSLGVKYAMIGHYERRSIFKEDDNLINLKLQSALKNNLKVILCIGDNGNYQDELKKQINTYINNINENVTILYEPYSAITGTEPMDKDKITEITSFIKSLLPPSIKVLYGGSVTQENINELNTIPNIDGFAVGKESLDVNSIEYIREVTK